MDPKQLNELPAKVQRTLKEQAKPQLLADPFWGDRIIRQLWPKRFKKLPDLFRFELQAYRGVYRVLTHPGHDREIRIVWLGNHKKYDRLFGYHTS